MSQSGKIGAGRCQRSCGADGTRAEGSKKLLTQHVGAGRQEDKELVPFDLDAWAASFVEVGRILPDPAEMLKRCASLIDKALGDVLGIFVASPRKWPRNGSKCVGCVFFYNFGAMCKGCWTSSSRSTTCLRKRNTVEELGGDLDGRLVHAELEARVRAYRVSLQAARGTIETVNEPPVFLRAYFVDWVKFMADAVESWLAYTGGDKTHTRLC